MIFYDNRVKLDVPKDLDIEQLSQKAKLENISLEADEIAWLCHTIYRRHDLLEEEDNSAVNLYSILLRKYLGRKHLASINFLIDKKVIVRSSGYRVGKYSYRYSFHEKVWAQESIKYTMVPGSRIYRVIVDNINMRHNCRSKYIYLHLNRWLSSELEINSAKAQELTAKNYEEDLSKASQHLNPAKQKEVVLKADKKRRYYERSVQRFINGQEQISRDNESTYRVYSLITGTPKALRPYVTYCGQELIQIDLKCSQLMLLLYFLNPENLSLTSFHKGDNKRIGAGLKVKEHSSKEFKSLKQVLEKLEVKAELNRYRKAVTEGDIYQLVADEMAKFNSKMDRMSAHDRRKHAKDRLLKELFDRTRKGKDNTAFAAFARLFPSVAEVCNFLKRRKYSDLAWLLQRLEAVIMIDNVCRRLALEHPTIPVFTLHDCVVTVDGFLGNTSYREIIDQIIKEEVNKKIGVHPRTEITSWAAEKAVELSIAA